MSTTTTRAARRPAAVVLVLALLGLLGGGAWYLGRQVWADHHFRAAQLALKRRDFAAAGDHLAVCLRVWPRDLAAHVLAARAARRAGDLAEAERRLDHCAGLPGLSGDLELERALLRAQRGELAAVEPFLLAHLRADAADAVLVCEVLAPAYHAAYRLDEALACLNLWEVLEPDYARVPYLKGDIFERKRGRAEARDCYRRAVELGPDRTEARIALARAQLLLDHAEAAWEQLAVLNERAPDAPEVRRLTVRCLRLLGRTDEARARLGAALARAPEDGDLLFEHGMLELAAGRPAEAEPWLRRANEKRPSERELLYQLALCLERNGKTAEAHQVRDRLKQAEADLGRLNEVVRLIAGQPRDAGLRCEAGQLMMGNGYPDEGRRWLESALAIDPRHGPSHQALAGYYQKNGDAARAEFHRRQGAGSR
jgi:tetratricopeptide (TPR) repeat protein